MALIAEIAGVLLLLAAIGAGYAIYQSSRPPEGSVDQFLKQPRPARRRVAVIFGDSTIHGRVGIDALPAVRDRLPAWVTVNAGHNGDTCARLLARVEPVLVCKADAIVIEVGGNDARDGVSPEAFRTDLTNLVDRLQASVARVGLCSFQVAGDDLSTPMNRLLDRYAQVMSSLAAERGLGYLPLRERMIAELDANPGGAAWNQNMMLVFSSILERHLIGRSVDEQSRRRALRFNPDGLHLNTRGAGILTEVIVEYLEALGG